MLRLQVALQGNCPKRALCLVHFPGLSCSGLGYWVFHKGTDSFGPALCALPRSEQLRQPGAWWTHCPRWAVHLSHLPGPSRLVYQIFQATRTPSQVCSVSPLGSRYQASTLLADINHPVSQEDLVSNWESVHNLVEDAISGAEIAPCLPALAVALLPLCLWQGDGPVCSWLAFLCYSLTPLFCEQTRLHLSLELYAGKFSLSLVFFLSLSGYPTVWVATYVISLRLSSEHSDLVFTLHATCASLSSTCLLVVDVIVWATSLLGLWLGTYFVSFPLPSQLCCPLRFQNTPQTHWWEGFLLFENFSSYMTPSLYWSPSLTLVSHFVFCILSYLLSNRMGCLSGCLVSSASIQKLYSGSCSSFKWPFDEFVGEKVVSPSYSSSIFFSNFSLK